MNKMNKILMIHRSLGVGGAEKIMAFISNEICSDYSVELLLLEEKEISLKLNSEIKLVQKNSYSDKPILGKKMVKGLNELKSMINEINEEIDEFNPDLIICFDLRILLALYLGEGKKNKILFSERADPNANPGYWQKILRYIYKKIDYIVFQTEQAQNFYGEKIKTKSCVIPNPAVNRKSKNSVTQDEAREKIIFSAGRMQYRKGFDLLIAAFSKISSNFPEYKLVIYGEGEQKNILEEMIKNLDLKERVVLKMPENHVVSKNRNAALFVLPSRSEGIPNILIEAMIEEIPCVACDCSPGGARLLSDNGKYCLLAENDDVDSLAEMLMYALSHEESMHEMAQKAHKSMIRFSPDTIIAQWCRIIKKLI